MEGGERMITYRKAIASVLLIACQRKIFPDWTKSLLEKVKDGKLLTSVEEMLEIT
jgi:hypothetical protein